MSETADCFVSSRVPKWVSLEMARECERHYERTGVKLTASSLACVILTRAMRRARKKKERGR